MILPIFLCLNRLFFNFLHVTLYSLVFYYIYHVHTVCSRSVNGFKFFALMWDRHTHMTQFYGAHLYSDEKRPQHKLDSIGNTQIKGMRWDTLLGLHLHNSIVLLKCIKQLNQSLFVPLWVDRWWIAYHFYGYIFTRTFASTETNFCFFQTACKWPNCLAAMLMKREKKKTKNKYWKKHKKRKKNVWVMDSMHFILYCGRSKDRMWL